MALFIIGIFLVIFLLMNQRLAQTANQLTQQLNQTYSQVNNQLNSIMSQVNERLKENSQTLHSSTKDIGDKLISTSNIITGVQNSLHKLDEANKRIYEVGKDISSLQQLLRAPSFRGEVGEFMLSNLLGQILPSEHFVLKYQFKNNEIVDAVINIGSSLVPVDSKFPLSNFIKMIESLDEASKLKSKKEFVKDVKKHIDCIASKYILPDEGTFDFALMYVPAENVYYEAIIKDQSLSEQESISAYALSKKVIPVSPNSFYAYLQAIILGLKGLRIEKGAQDIIRYLSRLQGELAMFRDDFAIVGKHIVNTKNKYDEADKKLDRFAYKLVGAGEYTKIEE